jgi:D-serine deaminase-like pyridoxal phosphate-dependent protein
MTLPLYTLDTPAALLDEHKLTANIARMQSRMNALGVAFRPHVKTAKCVEVARRQRAAGARGITVSTLKEAQAFFEAGFDDILYAVGIIGSRLPQVQALRERGCGLKITVDSLEAAQAVATHGQEHGHTFEVLIEVDTDGHRAGVLPASAALLEIGQALHTGGVTLAGVMTHAGASYNLYTEAELVAFAEQERGGCVQAAQRLRAAGLPCPIVSVGSTPTALSAAHLQGVTEVRAGVYVFQDLVMAGVGVCTPEDIALSVLGTVIGHQPDRGWVLIDAGWMALSRDRGTQAQPVDRKYGLVCDEHGTLLPDLIVSAANQEHGIVSRLDGAADTTLRERFPLGSRLRVLPNHACATGAQFDRYHLLGEDGSVAVWPRFGGW